MTIFFRFFLFVVFLIVDQGCAFFMKDKRDFLADFKKEQVSGQMQFFKMKEQDLFKNGEKLLIVPFVAGQSVAENNALHKTSLMMIRGVYDAFTDDKARFKLMTQETMAESDFIVEGHVVEWFEPSWFSRIFLRNKKKILRVEGKMTDLDSGKMVFVFEDQIGSLRKEVSYEDLGYILGVRLAKTILSYDKKSKELRITEGDK